LALSISTVIAYTAILMVVIAVALVLPGTRGRRRRWLLAASLPFFIGCLSAATFLAERTFPGPWLETLGIALAIAAYSTGWHVVRGFAGRPANPAWAAAIPLSYAAMNLLVFHPRGLEVAEVLYRAGVMLVLNLLMAREMASGRAENLPSRPLLHGVFSAFAALAALRIALAYWLPSPLGAAPPQAWAVVAYNLSVVTQALLTAMLLVALAREADIFRSDALSLEDPMTGALNRRALKRHGAALTAGNRPLTVFVFDLDHFKQVNDRFGHLVGDTVICAAVETARKTLRKEDAVFRLGGEEFACVLRDVTPEAGFSIAERLCRGFEKAGQEVAGHRVEATMSVGVASAPAGVPVHLDDLIARADRGLYAAKRRGRNQVVEAA